LAEEFSAITGGPDNFIEIYQRATAKPYGFLFITTGANPRFYSSYDFEFKINSTDEER